MKNLVLPQIVAAGVFNAKLLVKNSLVTPSRKTTMFEIEVPIAKGGISYMDHTARAISENLVICAKPGQIRHTRLPFTCYFIHMIVNEGKLYDMLSSLPDYIEPKNSDEIRGVLVSICEYYQLGTPESEVMLQSLVLKLCFMLDRLAFTDRERYQPRPNNHKIIEDTLDFIHSNLAGDLSLEVLCERAGFTSVYFHKLFKASTGKTLQKYVEEARIKKAVNLLLSTEMTLSRIAYECGFSSQSYFSFVFKRSTGTTPRNYAKSLLTNYGK